MTEAIDLLALLLAQHLGFIILSFSIIISVLLIRKQISQLIQLYPVKSAPNPINSLDSSEPATIQKEEEKPSQIQIQQQQLKEQRARNLHQQLASLEEEDKKLTGELAERKNKIIEEISKLGIAEPQIQKPQKRKPKPQETTQPQQESSTPKEAPKESIENKLLELAKGESHE